ncbi:MULTISPECIES: type II and III secretion system protein family protein [unclassified Sphingomonas]|uniref:type II and III secretion system protein family protein n=1 Tax=unclassified Sphingomonas TaxID=196159 RepID=UPI002269F4E2|nr:MULTISPECIES: type II and III secretion system protein family protein [unclassified Sphingomonas]
MRNRLIPLALPIAAALVVSPVAAAPGRPATAAMAATALPAVVQVATGRGRLITLAQPMSDLFVADDNIADVQVRSPTQLYVFGKKGGETTISATAKGGGVVFSATVRVGNNFDSIGQMLGLAMPEAHVVATPMNGLVLLTGTVAAPEDAAEAERLVQAFVGDTVKVITRLKTATPLQVNLQVRIAEVSRSFIKNVGVNLASADSTGGFKFGIAQGRAAGSQFSPGGPLGTGVTNGSVGTSVITAAATGSTFGFAGHLLGLDLLGAIDLGETTGQVTTLANPNLTALSGETGTFLAGGEVPIPIAQGLGAVSVEYKQYGVGLSYTPTVLSDGRISLRVKPEVSQLDYSNAVTLNGTRVPGLTTRRTETTVELGSGQSMMISGLLSNSHNNSIDKAPGLGDLPIIGALFRSNSWQRNETELVIIITPYLVKPVNNQRDIALPSDGYKAPTDLGRVLMGDLAKGTRGGQRPVPTAVPMETNPTIGAAASVPVVPAPPARSAAADARRDQPEAKPLAKSAKPLPAPGFSE